MARSSKVQGMSSGKKARGRSATTGADPFKPTNPDVPVTRKTNASRPISAGTGHRGDRRDTSPTYTGNDRHASRGNTPRPDVKTRKR